MSKPREVIITEDLLKVRDGQKELNIGDRWQAVEVPGCDGRPSLRSSGHGDPNARLVDCRVAKINTELVRERGRLRERRRYTLREEA